MMKMFIAFFSVYACESLREESQLPPALFRSSSCFSHGTVEMGAARLAGGLKSVVFWHMEWWSHVTCMTFSPDIAFCALDPSVGYCREAHMELQQVNKQSNVQRQKGKPKQSIGKWWKKVWAKIGLPLKTSKTLETLPLWPTYPTLTTSVVFLPWRWMSLLPAMELHLRVPADHWCLTFNEFFQFVEDVRAAWLVGEILQSETWHTFVGAKGNELTCVGPNMSRRSRMCLFSIQCSLSCKGCAMFGQNHVERERERFRRAAPFPNLRKAIQIRYMSAAVMGQISTRLMSIPAVHKHGGRFHALNMYKAVSPLHFGCFSGLITWQVVSDIQAFLTPFDCLGCFETGGKH